MKKLCPYCKQEIDENEKICPFCDTKLEKNEYEKFLLPLGSILCIIWFIINIALFIIIIRFPQFAIIKNKEKNLILSYRDYVDIFIQPLVIILIPYIVAYIRNYRQKAAIVGIIITAVCAICFILYFTYLYKVIQT